MRVGIFGGTFDPVHTGHIEMAKRAKTEFALDRVVFVPNANPPHKKNKEIADFCHRYEMLKLATDGESAFSISDYESADGKFYYSLHTMRHFRELYGDETYFIIGADSLVTIDRWYEYATLLKENKFIVFLRDDAKELYEMVEKYRSLGAKIEVSKMKEVGISSTKVREKIRNNDDVFGIISNRVYDYIIENELYGG